MIFDRLKLYEEHGHPTQTKHCGEPVFYATTGVGPLNQVVHCELGAHQSQECRIPKSTWFSPA
jgi:hypothetical protein